jgi:citrate synthase
MEKRITTRQASEILGVKPATVYAYASRGLLRSRRSDDGRTSLFDRAEVEELAARGRKRQPERERAGAIVASGITSIDGDTLAYRGRPVSTLLETPFEQVAEHLWQAPPAPPASWLPTADVKSVADAASALLPPQTLPSERMRLVVAALAATDPIGHGTTRPSVPITARPLIGALIDSLPVIGRPPPHEGLAARLWPRLTARRATEPLIALLNSAMVLLADHELSPSTFAVRIAASVRSSPYSTVLAGMSVTSGSLHGAASLGAEELLAAVTDPSLAPEVVGRWLRRGERIPGAGQPIYRSGDPRARMLLERLRPLVAAKRMAPVDAVIAVLEDRQLPQPNVDFALAALAVANGMVRGAGEAIFVISRCAGWIAHALEEYERPGRYRPRAVYIGPPVER